MQATLAFTDVSCASLGGRYSSEKITKNDGSSRPAAGPVSHTEGVRYDKCVHMVVSYAIVAGPLVMLAVCHVKRVHYHVITAACYTIDSWSFSMLTVCGRTSLCRSSFRYTVQNSSTSRALSKRFFSTPIFQWMRCARCRLVSIAPNKRRHLRETVMLTKANTSP